MRGYIFCIKYDPWLYIFLDFFWEILMQNLDVKYYEFCLTYKMRFSNYDKSFPIRHYYLKYNFLIFQWLYGNMWCHSVRRPITWHVLGRLYSWNITKKCFILLVDLFQITTKQHCTKSAGKFDFSTNTYGQHQFVFS